MRKPAEGSRSELYPLLDFVIQITVRGKYQAQKTSAGEDLSGQRMRRPQSTVLAAGIRWHRRTWDDRYYLLRRPVLLSSRQRCWSGSVFAVSLQSTSGTSAFPLHSSKAASVCDLPLLELYWFHALRQPPGSGVSPSTDPPSGTVCHQHYTFAGSVAEHLQAGTEDASFLIRPATLSRFETLPLLINLPTYLLTYLLTWGCSV